MEYKTYYFHVRIKETDLDAYHHVNNVTYLRILEEARWEFLHQKGYGFHKIHETGRGPVVLETNIKYLKELKLRDEVIIETKFLYYENKVGKMSQRIVRDGVVCCEAEFTVGFFDLKARKLIHPTDDWKKVVDADQEAT